MNDFSSALKEVPENISSFYKTNCVQTFQYDQSYHRDTKDKQNEFKVRLLSLSFIDINVWIGNYLFQGQTTD